MKTSIRSKKFTMGMVLFLVIILLLSISSGYYLNRLSSKTSAILKENHYSVVYARDMSENLININQGIINCFLIKKNHDTLTINSEFKLFTKSLMLEKNNLTEIGEDVLVSNIELNYNNYRDSVMEITKSQSPIEKVLNLQKKFVSLHQQLILLSQMNEKAIEEKTNDAKVSAKNATLQMTFIATLCFLIAYGYTFIFSSYFNDRFYKLYNGIKEVVANNYHQRISIKGNDELSEISVIFNEMAEKLSKENQKKALILDDDMELMDRNNDVQELKIVLSEIKRIEKQAINLITAIENKKQ